MVVKPFPSERFTSRAAVSANRRKASASRGYGVVFAGETEVQVVLGLLTMLV